MPSPGRAPCRTPNRITTLTQRERSSCQPEQATETTHGSAIQISRRGYEATSFADIAAQAGVGRNSLRYHYATKDEFAKDVLAYEFARWRQLRETVEAAALRGVRAVLAMQQLAIRQFIAEPQSRAAIHLLLNASVLPINLERPGRLTDWHPYFRRHLDDAIAAGEVRADLDADQTVGILAGTLLGRAMRLPPDRDRELLSLMRPSWEATLAAMGVADPAGVLDGLPDLELPEPPSLPERNRHTRAQAGRPRVVRLHTSERVEQR